MSENSKIEWTDHTFNPWEGCQKVSPGCDHCYAETRNARFAGGQAINWGPGAPRRRTSAANWRKPLAWNMENFVECEACGHRGVGVPWRDVGPNMGIIDDGHQCEACGSRSVEPARARVFCASLADVFDNAVDPAWRADLLELIDQTPNLDWLLLTKRIGNVVKMLPNGWLMDHTNVWLGASIVNQAEADRDIPKLADLHAHVKFLSMEPLLGPVRLDQNAPDERALRWYRPMVSMLDWVIVGGESGPGARPMHPAWAQSLRDQCAAAGVPFLFKQWGEWTPGVNVERHSGTVETAHWWNGEWIAGREDLATVDGNFEDEPDLYRVGKKAAGRLLDGVQHDGYPSAKSGTF